jgi:hypothetical protein
MPDVEAPMFEDGNKGSNGDLGGLGGVVYHKVALAVLSRTGWLMRGFGARGMNIP